MGNSFDKIAMVGAGNVAWHLAPVLEAAGCAVTQVYSRSEEKAKELVIQLYQAEVQTQLDFSNSLAELFILAVSDDTIAEVARQIQLPAEATIVHTSGGQSLNALAKAPTERIGVFYPLQTFSKLRPVDFRDIPICLESDDSKVLHRLTKLARGISRQVKLINSEERAQLHVAAVLANNFTNHLLRMAEELLNDHQLDFTLLHPLIEETVAKALEIGPAQSQTGPACRYDEKTINHHLKYLRTYDPAYAKVYKALTQHIQAVTDGT
ncbi:MAG: DUF2520 domain-containing protein [Bacteroidota bacterium]